MRVPPVKQQHAPIATNQRTNLVYSILAYNGRQKDA